jgi:short-subunit dehydrogenase
MRASSLQENVVVLTGASSGIGHRLALQLVERGAWLALAARNAAKLEEVCFQCRQRGGRAIGIPTDVADETQCRSLIERTVAEYGRIDTVINNAGIGLGARFEELRDLAPVERVMQVNFFGSIYCSYYALPYLKETKGRLVGICSLAGRFPAPRAAAYAASKHAMAGFFDSLRVELADTGVSVTMIYPGWVATGISSRAMNADGKPIGEISVHEEGATTPDSCARLIVRGIVGRRREIVMTPQGKLGLWLRLLAPKVVDEISRRTML